MAFSLEIKGKRLKLEFGLSLFRILGRKWGLNDVNETVVNISKLNGDGKTLSYSQMDILEDILLAAIENADDSVDTTNLKVIDEFFKDPNALQSLTLALTDSMPKSNVEDKKVSQGKPKVVKATRSKKG